MNKSTQTGCVEVKKKSNSTQTDPDLSVDLFEESITESTIIIQSAQTEGVEVKQVPKGFQKWNNQQATTEEASKCFRRWNEETKQSSRNVACVFAKCTHARRVGDLEVNLNYIITIGAT